MDKLKLNIQRFAPTPPTSGNLIDEDCLYEYHQNIKNYYAPKTITGDLTNLTTTSKTDLVSAINEINGLQAVELYTNPTLTHKTSITLSDNASNYKYLEIFYYYYGHSSMKSVTPGSTSYINICQVLVNSGYMFFVSAYWEVSGTSMSLNNEERWRIGTSGNATRTQNTNNLIVEKVIGYK